MLDTEDPIYTAFVHQVENLLTIRKQTKWQQNSTFTTS
jgi:hypothetical protein